jgi:hypothetical protein
LRRSLFSSDAERSSFLNRLVTGCRDIMRNNKVCRGRWKGMVFWGGGEAGGLVARCRDVMHNSKVGGKEAGSRR